MSSLVTLKAAGLQTQPNQLDLPQGALTVASNVVINRDNVIEKRRGFSLYGNSFGSSTNVLKQLMEYQNRLIRHYLTTLQYDDGTGNFTNFPGSFSEPVAGTRIKYVISNNNLYFTTSDGIQKISSSNSTLADAVVSNAGGVKAIDLNTTLAYTYGSSTGFLPQDSAVAYRAVWGITDPNNNLVLGTPSPRSTIYNPLAPLLAQDFSRLTVALDNAAQVPGSQALTDTNFTANYPVSDNTNGQVILTDLIALATQLDTNIYPALPTLASSKIYLPNVSTAIYNTTTDTVTYTFASAHNLNAGDSVTFTDLSPAGYNGTFTVSTVNNATSVTVNNSINPGTFNMDSGTGTSNYKNVAPLSFSAGPPSVINIVFSSTPSLEIGDNVKIANVLPSTYNGNYIVSYVNGNTVSVTTSTTSTTATTLTDPGTFQNATVTNPITKIKYQTISQPATLNIPETDQDLVNVQTYMQNIILQLQNYSETVTPVTATLTSVTWSAGNATFTYSTPHGLTAGEQFRVSGAVPSGYNGDYIISSSSTTTTVVVPLATNPGVYVGNASTNRVVPDISNANLSAYIDALNITTTANVNVTVNIPQAVISAGINEYFLQVYRSDITQATGPTVLSDLSPDDEMQLIYEIYPTQAQLNAGFVTFLDDTPIEFAGADLYTNQSTGEGILQANEPPPFAVDIARFKNVTFYANTKRKQTLLLSLLGVSNMIAEYNASSRITPSITITNGTNTVTYNFVTGLAQQTYITTTADTSNSLNGTYFDIFSANNATDYRFYYKTTGGTDTPPTVTTQTLVQIPILTGSTAAQVASKTSDIINQYNQDFVSVLNTTTQLLVSTVADGYTNATTAGNTGFTVSVAQSGQGESTTTNPKQVLLSTSESPATAVDETARSLITVINNDPNSPVYAYYVSTENSVPGQIQLEARNLDSSTVYLLAGDSVTGASFNPSLSANYNITAISSSNPAVVTTSAPHNLVNGDTVVIAGSNSPVSINGTYSVTIVSSTQFSIPVNTSSMATGTYTAVYSGTAQSTSSTNETLINRVYYSKLQQPEAVPLVNYIDVGDSDKQILRIFPLRDSLFVFKEEGLYRISGEVAPFTLALFDSSCIMVAPDSLGVVSNLIFAWTKKGIETISESGTSLVSRPIDTNILQLSSNNYTNFKTATFGIGYESDKSYLVWTVSSTIDTLAQICYRYSTVTGAWTTYDKTNTCGLVKLLEDKLFLGAGDTNYMEQERKVFDRTDYADRELTFNLTSGNYQGNNIKLSSLTGISVGDALGQVQTLTPYTFNMLLKKLDIDPGSKSTSRFATFQAFSGDDMRTDLVALASNLDSSSLGFNNYSSIIASKTGSIGNQTIGGSVVQITSTAHGLSTGRYININGNTSSPSINGNWTVTVIDANTFSIPTVVITSVADGSWLTLNEDFTDLQGCYNLLINQLNDDSVIAFNNYQTIVANTAIESIVTALNPITNTITVNTTLPYIVGPMTIYKAFDSSVIYAPITMGDPLGLKHLSEATVMFDNRAFTNATVSFATDMLPAYNSIMFNGDGNGIYGNGTYGQGFYGGASNSGPFRTYIPRNNQRCRTLSVKFDHNIARENIILYGITVTGQPSYSTRAYRN